MHPHPRCPPPISRNLTTTRPITASFSAKRKWPTSVSPRFMSSTGKTLAAVCSWPADAVVAAAAEDAAAVAEDAAAASAVAAAISGLLAAVVAAASAVAVAAAAAGSVASFSVPAWAWWLAWVARLVGVAAAPGERAACAKCHENRRCDSLGAAAAIRQAQCGPSLRKCAPRDVYKIRSLATCLGAAATCPPALGKLTERSMTH